MADREQLIEQAARIAGLIDWNPTCLPGQHEATIVRQILESATDLGVLADPAALLNRLADLTAQAGKQRSTEWLRACAALPPGEWPPAPAYKGPMVPAAERDALQAENESLKAAIRDIDAHATPIGLLNNDDPDGSPHHYAVTVGALHRALRWSGTAPKCSQQYERAERLQARIDVALADLKEADELSAEWPPSLKDWTAFNSKLIHARAALQGDQPTEPEQVPCGNPDRHCGRLGGRARCGSCTEEVSGGEHADH